MRACINARLLINPPCDCKRAHVQQLLRLPQLLFFRVQQCSHDHWAKDLSVWSMYVWGTWHMGFRKQQSHSRQVAIIQNIMHDVLTQRSLSTAEYKVFVLCSWQKPSGQSVLHHILNYWYVCCSKNDFAVHLECSMKLFMGYCRPRLSRY